MRILFDIEWGYVSDAPVRLHPAVVRTLGARLLRSGFALVRPNIVAGYPVLVSQSSFGRGVLVTVNILTPDKRPAKHVFVLMRLGGRWVDVYDSVTMLGAALAVESRIQSLSVPLSTRASTAAANIETRLQRLALALLRTAGLPQGTQS